MNDKWRFILESIFQNITKAIEQGIDSDPAVSPEIIDGMAQLHSAIIKSRKEE